MSKKILITGSSSGFGYLTARTLAEKGHTVFAGMRKIQDKNAGKAQALSDFGAVSPGSVHVLEMDVIDDASVNAAVARAMEIGKNIDAVVNNAGCGAGGWLEAFTLGQLKGLFDVNVFGIQRVNRAIIPHMRRQGSGLLVHLSSTLGRMLMPFSGPYCATKFAVEALAESYRFELAHFNIDSVIVEPGGFGTNFFANIQYSADYDRLGSMGPLADLPMRMWNGPDDNREEKTDEENPEADKGGFHLGNPQLVADAIVQLIEMPFGTRPLRTVVDPMGGEGVEAINRVSSQVQTEVYRGMGIGTYH